MNYEVISGYHDTSLRSVGSGEASDTLLLAFELNDGRKESINLYGCEFFRMTDFVVQNIVSRLLVFRGHNIDVGSVIEKLKWASSLSDTTTSLSHERLDVLVERIRNGEVGLFVLEPSWGAELVAVFNHISYQSNGDVTIKSLRINAD